jgi:hypothetical protein
MSAVVRNFLDAINSVLGKRFFTYFVLKSETSEMKVMKAPIEVYAAFDRAIVTFSKDQRPLWNIAGAFNG